MQMTAMLLIPIGQEKCVARNVSSQFSVETMLFYLLQKT